MKTRQMILFALTGWVAGVLVTLGWSFLWPKIIPIANRASALPGGWKILLIIFVALMTPAALAGGLIGGRLPKEGGQKEQILYSVLFGVVLALLFGSCGFWYLGW